VNEILLKCLAAVIALAATNASAQDASGGASNEPRWYGAIDGGYHWPLTIDSRSVGLAPDGLPYDWRWKTNSEWAALGRIGYRLSSHVRIELEGGYRQSSLNSVTAPGGVAGGLSIARPGEPYGLCSRASIAPACVAPSGADKNWVYTESAMANVMFDILPRKRFDPFVGAGVGIEHIQWNANYAFSNVPGPITPTNPAHQIIQLGGSMDRLSQFAFQVLGGVSYRATRRLSVDFTYRFLAAEFLRWNTDNNTPGIDYLHGLQPRDFRGALEDQALTVGLRYGL